MKYPAEDNFINSIVGEGTHFRGQLEPAGLLRIDGDFTGSIRSGGKVLIGKHGRADCSIEAATVVIGGVIRGSVYASEKVIVLSTGLVLGNIYSPRLVAEEGVLMDGEFSIRGDRAAEEPLPVRTKPMRTNSFLTAPEPVETAARSTLHYSLQAGA